MRPSCPKPRRGAVRRLACRLLVVLAPAALGAQAPAGSGAAATSAPVRDVRHVLTIDAAHVARRAVGVRTTFGTAGDAPVLLSLPAWTPGAYELSHFAGQVRAFAAHGLSVAPGGTDTVAVPLAWERADPDTWRIVPGGATRIRVQFEVRADQLDNAMSWTGRDVALVNGTTVFLHPEGADLDRHDATVEVRTEPEWQVVTAMRPRAGGSWGQASYHDLVDMPFLVGRLDVDSAEVAGRWMRLATWPRGSVAGAARAATWDALRRVVPPMAAVFGEVPWPAYTILQVADPAAEGASGLEHQDSHVDVVSPLAIGTTELLSLYAHEIFHAWNVKRLRPAALVPYRYDRWQPTPWLWVSEGVTDYHADLALVRGGIVDVDGFLAATTAKLQEVDSLPAVALADAAIATWVQPVDGTHHVYYPKGALAGLALDAMIRDASDGRRSLDDVLRDLYQGTWRRGRGFTADDWWGAVRRAAGRDAAAGVAFADFDARFVRGREPLPLAAVLPRVGLAVVADSVREPRLGLSLAADTAGALVAAVEPGGAAARGGVRAGDVLLAIADVPLGDEQAAPRLARALRAAAAAGVVPVRVRRAGGTLSLALRPELVLHVRRRVALDPAADERARRLRAGLLGAPAAGAPAAKAAR